MVVDPPASPGPAGLYLHSPFCSVRCSYCDFPTVTNRDRLVEPYLRALAAEIEAAGLTWRSEATVGLTLRGRLCSNELFAELID